jgi:hypothetical protein
MRRDLLAVVAAASILACGAARAEVVVNISKSQQRLAVVVDGSEAYRWPVSTGRRGYATPSGVFHPVRMERHWYSHKYENAPMPWSVFFYRGYAVHGTMDAYNLGRAASHGCVRLRPDHARTLFGLIRRAGSGRTRIVVLDGPLPQLRHVPSDVPMAEAAPVEARRPFAKVLEKTEPVVEHLSARAHSAPIVRTAVPERVRHAVSASSEEARILREREAWLRSLDRKYGIVR